MFRLLGAPAKCDFLKDGMNIVDVLAILPYFISALVIETSNKVNDHPPPRDFMEQLPPPHPFK